MESKIPLIFFILIEAVILAFCDTDSFNSFGPRHNDKVDPRNLDLSKLKDFHLFGSNTLPSEAKNVGKKPTTFDERYSQSADSVNSLEIRQDISKTNFTEKQKEMTEFYRDAYTNWQNERSGSFYPNRQENQQETQAGETFNRRINPQANNEWGRNFFQNSQSRWNEEENFKQYQTARNNENLEGRIASVSNMGKPIINSDKWVANGNGKLFVNHREMNEYFPVKTGTTEKVSLTLLNDDDVKSYDHELLQNRFKNQLNSKLHYYNRNLDGFRSSHFNNPEKAVVINFNTECSTTKPLTNPIFHKFIFAPKSQHRQAEIPTFHIPETTLFTRQTTTPIYYL